jgi:hypothetical protein
MPTSHTGYPAGFATNASIEVKSPGHPAGCFTPRCGFPLQSTSRRMNDKAGFWLNLQEVAHEVDHILVGE